MRVLTIVLAFVSCTYVWLRCLSQWFAGPEVSGPLPINFAALRLFALLSTACCLIALKKRKLAVIAIWVVAISYALVSWRMNAGWVFRAEMETLVFWTPIFLTIAALIHKPAQRSLR
jgi:hypothetical protein